jgi:hypothetical protein
MSKDRASVNPTSDSAGLTPTLLAQAPSFQRALVEKGGSLSAGARKAILDAYALNSLKAPA